jgi:hypothetical protein
MPAQFQSELQTKKPHKLRKLLTGAGVVGVLLLLWWAGWPLFRYLRTGQEIEQRPITSMIKEVLTQPRSAIMGTSFSIRTIAAQGTKGERGDRGDSGPKGDKGENGERGAAGEKGEKGEAGSKGDQGSVGAVGSAGPQGPQGSQGPAGSDPFSFIQDGNSYGALATLGTNDAYGLAFETAGVQRALLDTLGNFTLENGNLLVNGRGGLGNLSAVDTTANMFSMLATGANTHTTGGNFTTFRLTSDYTPNGGDGSQFFNGLRVQTTVNSGDGSDIALQRGILSRVVNNSSGYLASLESYRGYAENNGTSGSRRGAFIQEYINNGTLTDLDTRTGEFWFVNNGTVPEHYGVVSTLQNTATGTALSGLSGYSSLVTNMGDAGFILGDRIVVQNQATGVLTSDVIGSSIIAYNNGGVASTIIGQRISAANRSAGTVDNVIGLDIAETGGGDQVSDTHQGIHIVDILRGAINNYGIYIEGASGGSGNNAALWVNSGLARFAPTDGTLASVRLESSGGTNVSSPVSGDLWWNGTNLFFNDGSSNIDLLAGGGGGGSPFVQNGNSFGSTAYLGTNDYENLALETNDVERVTIDRDGLVGIGDVSPDQRLVVDGNIRLSNSTLGIMLDNQDRPIITRDFDQFSSGDYTGAGRWGMFLEPGTLTFGTPEIFGNGAIQFARYNDDSTIATTTMIIDPDGNVGIGQTGPNSRLDIVDSRSNGYALSVYNDGDSTDRFGALLRTGEYNGSGTNRLMTFQDGDGDEVGSIEYNGFTTSYNTTSDQRMKENIEATALDLDDLLNIRIYDYNWKDRPELGKSHGVLAQELFTIYPQAVSKPADAERLWAVDYSKLVPLTIKSIQEQNTELAQLRAEVTQQSEKLGGVGQVAQWTNSVWTFIGEVIFNAKATFNAMAEFVGEVVFRGPVTFFNTVLFKNRVIFADKDMAGVAVIQAGQLSVEVKFDKAFSAAPVITVTPQGQVLAVAVDQVNAQGFIIKVSSPVAQPLSVSWTALAVQGASGSASVAPVATPAPSVNPSATPEASPTAAQSLQPSASPSVAPTATPQVSTTPAPTASPELSPAPSAVPSVESSSTPTASPTVSPEPTATPEVSPSPSL